MSELAIPGIERQADFCEFAYWHRTSGDIDPVYPVLTTLGERVCADEDELISLVLLYVAYYDLGSALTTWHNGWRPGQELSELALRRATGTERRAHRSIINFAEHIAALGLFHRQFGTWRDGLWPRRETATERWTALQQRLTKIRGNGRWAAYKTGEMLKSVVGWDIEPTDAGHAWSSGPRKGLIDLFPELSFTAASNDPQVIYLLDEHTRDLVKMLGQPVEQVETALCDWHSLLKGNYYVGHDIDLMLDQLQRAPLHVQRSILDARRSSFEWRWLGEVQGWKGVRKDLRQRYKRYGSVAWWT